jgi:hypothetical protein
MPLTKRERSIASKFRRYEAAKEQAKKFYDRADQLLMELAPQVLLKPARISEDGKKLQAHKAEPDEKGILGWGHAAVRQFSLKVVND